MEIKEIRCPHCNRLLAKGEATHIEIKCPRCGAYTILRASSAKSAGREPLFEVSHAPQAVSPVTPPVRIFNLNPTRRDISLANTAALSASESAVNTVAQNIESVNGNAANIAAIIAVWTAMSAIKMAPDAAQAVGLSQGACEAIQVRCEQILENVQAVTDVIPATPTKLGVCTGGRALGVRLA